MTGVPKLMVEGASPLFLSFEPLPIFPLSSPLCNGKWGANGPSPPSLEDIASAFHHPIDSFSIAMLMKLKINTTEFVWMDQEALSRARIWFQNSLCGKVFSKPHPFDQLKGILQAKWSEIGTFHISDLPNGYLLIRCETNDAMQTLLFDRHFNLLHSSPFLSLHFLNFQLLSSGCNCTISR